jgi:CheY-like chemotaxis protein
MPTKETISSDLNSAVDIEAVVRFSVLLNRELDRIGYPRAPRRSGKLAEDLKVVRTTSYTILKGLSMPKVEAMAILRQMGLSMDKLLDAYLDISPTKIDISIGGKVIAVGVRDHTDPTATPVIRTQAADGSYQLKVLAYGQPVPEGSTPVASIEFFTNKFIAVLDDEKSVQLAISEGLQENFDTVTFGSSHELLEYKGGLEMFSAFLIEWRLPNDSVVGEALIHRLRTQSPAPIFIMSGDITAGKEMTKVLSSKDIHHIGKPLDIFILSDRISKALKTFYPGN